MNKNKILTAVMAGTMMMGSVLPVCAATTDYDPISQTEVGESGTSRDTEVLYELGSTFSVVILRELYWMQLLRILITQLEYMVIFLLIRK